MIIVCDLGQENLKQILHKAGMQYVIKIASEDGVQMESLENVPIDKDSSSSLENSSIELSPKN